MEDGHGGARGNSRGETWEQNVLMKRHETCASERKGDIFNSSAKTRLLSVFFKIDWLVIRLISKH